MAVYYDYQMIPGILVLSDCDYEYNIYIGDDHQHRWCDNVCKLVAANRSRNKYLSIDNDLLFL